MKQTTADSRRLLVVGAGIVGLATARELLLRRRASLSVMVLEAEAEPALHQTGRNSGVLHSGLYYRPGSLKAQTCVAGRRSMLSYCEQHGIPLRLSGKIVVATRPEQLADLDLLASRGRENGLAGIEKLGPEGIQAIEPHAGGIAGLAIPETGVVDFRVVARTLAAEVVELGGEIAADSQVRAIRRVGDELEIEAGGRKTRTDFLVGCAGLHSDRLARMAGVDPGVQIVPFRGQYYHLGEARRHLVRTLVYPVPDPRFPFLGVHWTRAVDDQVHAGPSALLALSRHGYSLRQISLRDLTELVAFPGFWRLAARYWRTGLREIRYAASRRAFAKAGRELIPELRDDDLSPAPSGVRAQAVSRDGRLLDDFCLVEAPGMLHVVNAPSPAATASLEIARQIADRVEAGL